MGKAYLRCLWVGVVVSACLATILWGVEQVVLADRQGAVFANNLEGVCAAGYQLMPMGANLFTTVGVCAIGGQSCLKDPGNRIPTCNGESRGDPCSTDLEFGS